MNIFPINVLHFHQREHLIPDINRIYRVKQPQQHGQNAPNKQAN